MHLANISLNVATPVLFTPLLVPVKLLRIELASVVISRNLPSNESTRSPSLQKYVSK